MVDLKITNLKMWFQSILNKHATRSLYNVLFFGNDYFSIGSLKQLKKLSNSKRLVGDIGFVCCSRSVYNKKTKIFNNSPVVKFAKQNGIPRVDWIELKKTKRFSGYDLAVVASFGEFIPSSIANLFPCGSINIHPSLLPRWRGPAPIIHTILAGDQETGISFIELSKKKFDTGKIIYSQKYKVPSESSSDELRDYLSQESGKMLPYVLENLDQLKLNAIIQDEKFVTQAPKVNTSHGFIDFSTQNCYAIQRTFKGLPRKIAIQSLFDGKKVKFENILGIRKETVLDTNIFPGAWDFSKKENLLWIKCQKGWISTDTLQVELKKKKISASSFYNGYIIDKSTGKPGNKRFKPIASK